MKKYIKYFIPIIIVACILVYAFMNNNEKQHYKTITLEKEPEYIGILPYGCDLAIVIDGELMIYDAEGNVRNISVPFLVAEAYYYDEYIWLIDVDRNLYRAENSAGGIIMSDIILSDVKIFKSAMTASMAVNSSGELYVWGNNENGMLGLPYPDYIEIPTKIKCSEEIKDICFSNNGIMFVTNSGELYVSGMCKDGEGYVTQFSKAQNIEDVKSIHCNMFNYAICEDGSMFAWHSHIINEDGQVELCFDDELISTYDKGFENYIDGDYYVIGINEQGQLYYWGLDFIAGQIGKGGYPELYEPKKIPYLESIESVYTSYDIAYAKKGLTIYIISGQ